MGLANTWHPMFKWLLLLTLVQVSLCDWLFTCGAGASGKLGLGSVTNQNELKAVTLDQAADKEAIAFSSTHSGALLNSELYLWGANTGKMLGDLATADYYEPQKTTRVTKVSAVALQTSWSMVLASGKVYTWGVGTSGQLGTGALKNMYTTPTELNLNGTITAIAGGNLHGAAIADGKLWLWTAVSLGGEFSAAIIGGKMYMWGDNTYGQLGQGDTVLATEPKLVAFTGTVEQISLGRYHSSAIVDGELWMWGAGASGSIGNGLTTNQLLPVKVIGVKTAEKKYGTPTAVALGDQHSVAIVDNALYSWGSNRYGQLCLGNKKGQGTYNDFYTPQRLEGFTSYPLQIAAGGTTTGVVATFDCVAGEWTAWTTCSDTCEQTRTRDIINQGTACPTTTESQQCADCGGGGGSTGLILGIVIPVVVVLLLVVVLLWWCMRRRGSGTQGSIDGPTVTVQGAKAEGKPKAKKPTASSPSSSSRVRRNSNGRAMGREPTGQRFFAAELLTPQNGSVQYFGEGYIPKIDGIQAFCREMPIKCTSDNPVMRGKGLAELWVQKNKSLKANKEDWMDSVDAQTVFTYTVESELYKTLNKSMREGSYQQLRSKKFALYIDYIYFLQKALNCAQQLNSRDKSLYRGISAKVNLAHYKPGSSITWQAFSSTTQDCQVAINFLGGTAMAPSGTLFFIRNCRAAKGIATQSAYPEEEEWLYPPNTHFRVADEAYKSDVLRLHDNILDQYDMSDVHLIVLAEL
eukprot:CAMPEP_0174322650 /NCGR_PEP_ID=MMETSP0810-20121108/11160_1 /TAXON_ID=73025 ORGANISM="Eutreptiella gymnastica-like, Strain CCMP1594" /NCGR_SAMPLE_ID=MMETSP0810 /ASSEMBLY_ACC=CAM_ASM_000659 /LENGTH=745 /DNA_ID=CAMNT_0015434571 /DNA_START=16 /DNA_END=2253 /DNA_ORIENTATION=-